jgi:anti-sigma factor RsiW
MATPPTVPRTGCPDLGLLAAFVDGRLVGPERAAVVAHLADCDACRETVAEAAAIAAEQVATVTGGGAAVLPFPERARGRRRLPLAVGIVAALALVGAAMVFQGRRPDTDAVLAALGGSPEITTRLGAGWSDPLWSVTRGEGPRLPERARAFRLGARGADLELALRSGDATAARRLAAECAWLAGGVPLADPVAASYRDLDGRIGAGGLGTAELLDAAASAARLAREAVDPAIYDLGRWSESGRLLATAGSGLRVPKPPALPGDLPGDLRELVERAARPELGGGPDASVAAFSRLIAAGGDLR